MTHTAEGIFTVSQFVPIDHVPDVTTALGVGHAHMVKTLTGAVEGRSSTQFSYAFSEATGVGTYVAMESFEGTVDDRRGTFNFAHSATTDGVTRTDEFFLIVPSSGTGELTGIIGTGALVIDGETERIRLDYELPS